MLIKKFLISINLELKIDQHRALGLFNHDLVTGLFAKSNQSSLPANKDIILGKVF